MAPRTRSFTKKLMQLDRRYHIFLQPTSNENVLPRITRSVIKNLKSVGISIPLAMPYNPAPIRTRRATTSALRERPARRAVRSHTTHCKITFLHLRFQNVKTSFFFKIVFNSRMVAKI